MDCSWQRTVNFEGPDLSGIPKLEGSISSYVSQQNAKNAGRAWGKWQWMMERGSMIARVTFSHHPIRSCIVDQRGRGRHSVIVGVAIVGVLLWVATMSAVVAAAVVAIAVAVATVAIGGCRSGAAVSVVAVLGLSWFSPM